MTAEEKIAELQSIIDQKENNRYASDKENQENERVAQLEGRLRDVVKVNEMLIDELNDRKYRQPDVRDRIESEVNRTEREMEARIVEVMRNISGSEKNVGLVQDVVSQAMSQFKDKISRDQDSDGEDNRYFEERFRKSESFQPFQPHNQKFQRSSSNNSESPKSIQGTYASTFDAHIVSSKPKKLETSIKSTPKLTPKPVSKKSSNHYYKPKSNKSKTAASQKQLSGVKKPKNTKYLNFIDLNKNKEAEDLISKYFIK